MSTVLHSILQLHRVMRSQDFFSLTVCMPVSVKSGSQEKMRQQSCMS